ncbi:hypothetical protein YC2023_065385 [Brassica napus]
MHLENISPSKSRFVENVWLLACRLAMGSPFSTLSSFSFEEKILSTYLLSMKEKLFWPCL